MNELFLCNGTLSKGTIAKTGGPRNFAVLLVILESIGTNQKFSSLTIDEIASRCGRRKNLYYPNYTMFTGDDVVDLF